jgi:hypothetical protein
MEPEPPASGVSVNEPAFAPVHVTLPLVGVPVAVQEMT